VWVFDGQHKAAARLYDGSRTLPLRLFTKYDYKQLKETNFRAHTDLVQMEFFKSIASEVGSGMFGDAFKKYLEKHSHENVSENTFIQSIELPKYRSEMNGHFKQWLKFNILHPENNNPSRQNKMSPFIEGEKTRERQKPISYDSFEKSIMRYFVYMYPSDELIAPSGSEHLTNYLRFEERDNLIKLMNMIADKILIGKFDVAKGADKLESRLSKGDKIPDDHVRAYRIFRPRVFEVWCDVLKEVIKTSLKIKGKLSEKNAHDGKIFWCKLSDDDWQQIDDMLNKIFNHKIWETKDREMIEAIATTKKDTAEAFITEGKIGDKKAFEPPINTQYLLS
jgi:hypothetical protein